MKNRIMFFFIVQTFIFFIFGQTSIYANETPENILQKYLSIITPDEVNNLLTGLMKTQFEGLNKEQQKLFIKHNQMKHYQAQTVVIKDSLQLVFVTSIEGLNRSSQEYPIIYEFHKVGEQWKISNRMSGHIIIDLFKQDYSPGQFHTNNFFQFGGKKVQMESTFAYFKKSRRNDAKKDIIILFYPFKFQERDIEYFKYKFGRVVDESDKATTITSSLKYPRGELTLYLDEQNKIISFCVNGYNFNNQYQSFNYCLQENLFKQFNISEKIIKLQIKENFETPTHKNIGCDVNIALPLFKEGIDYK